jgi:chromosome segregation ATPase
MNLTDREKLLLPFFPAILVFAIYAWAFGTRVHGRWTTAQDELAAMEQDAAGSVTTQQIWQQEMRLKDLRRRIEQAEQRQAALRQQADELTGTLTARRRDIDAMDSLIALLQRHRIILEDELPARGPETAGMAASLEQALRTLQEAVTAPQTAARARTSRTRARVTTVTRPASTATQDSRLRRIRFHGRFTDVLAALNELARTDDGAVAVSLEMDPIGADGLYSNIRRWTLWLRV